MMRIGSHYSSVDIPIGSIIVSDQTNARTYSRHYGIYKAIADELGVYFPAVFGYAYPEDHAPRSRSCFSHCYNVEAPADSVAEGCYRFSIYVSMSMGFSPEIKRIPSLADRIAAQDALIKETAKQYFTVKNKDLELISDKFVVVGRI